MDLIQSATFLVNPRACLVARVLRVGIGLEEILEHDAVRIGAADGKGVAHHGPLRLAVEAKHFAEIVNETGENEPARLAVLANLFGGLQQVFELRHVCVWIAVVHEVVQKLRSLPDTHLPTV